MRTTHCFTTGRVVLSALRRGPTLTAILLGSLCVLGLARNAQARHNPECSNASLNGAYGFYNAGTVVPDATPRVVVARASFDGKGNWSTTATVNTNGTVTHVLSLGTYEVNADCTGTIFNIEGQGIQDFVLVDGGKEYYFIRTSPATLVLYGVAKKQFPEDDQDG